MGHGAVAINQTKTIYCNKYMINPKKCISNFKIFDVKVHIILRPQHYSRLKLRLNNIVLNSVYQPHKIIGKNVEH